MRGADMACILLVDDETEILSWMKISLERMGHEVLEARDGASGLEVLRNNEVDLVVTDMVMPQMSGLSFIMEIGKEKNNPKIIAISGGGVVSGERYLSLAQEIGAEKILSKPFGEKILLEAVSEVLAEGQ